MLDIFKDLKEKKNFKEIVEDPKLFYKMDDNFVWSTNHKIVENIKARNLYKHIMDIDESSFGNVIDNLLEKEGDDLIFYEMKFGYKKEMFDEIYFYNLKNISSKFKKKFKDFVTDKIIRIIKF
tara:strand:- start:663 stop:1031 length:369 start_codon:yes stop_codon:yes gene_type:complete